ncbi:MucR family transcriptional regulator [Sphingomonas aerophila]|uniref:Putative transcriptional regulator n=1 Tax=Sphingomonas aerophila TaxID=1344948 RepID=A0A7W9BGZ2_9SPHN|nr:putative transcriptional regulator [Sphingomonas aerophila]
MANDKELATALTVAWLSNGSIDANVKSASDFLRAMYDVVTDLDTGTTLEDAWPNHDYISAVSLEESLADPDHIISMIDGKPYKLLRRHLMHHGLTPEAYRLRYRLPSNYPMVPANYVAKRRDIAARFGLNPRAASRSRQEHT